MGKRILGIISVSLMLPLLLCASAQADGGLFGKEGRDISEPEQKAVIFFHGGAEELILSVRFEGAADDFGWLVPTPEPPRIEESGTSLFEMMSIFTPSVVTYGEGRGMWKERTLGEGVDVLDELTVGAFDLTVVRADDAGDLRSWLEERGFAYDEEAEKILAGYIERGWCFTAMRINPSVRDPMQGDLEHELSQGIIDPLRFTFDAPEPIYPLRISSLNPGETEVLLYVLGPQAYGHEGMQLEYAERWQPVQIGALKEFSELAGEMEKNGGCCLTKLRRTYSPEQMEDLYLSPLDSAQLAPWPSLATLADKNDRVPWWALLAIVLALAVLAGVAYIFSSTRRNGWLKKAAAVFLIISLISSAILIPLGIWVLPAENAMEDEPKADWPWEDDILVTHNGWSKLIHPDGRVEIRGLDEQLSRLISPQEVSFQEYPPDLILPGRQLDEEGRWEWSVRHFRADTWQTRYLAVRDRESGTVREVDIGVKEVHDVRLSPQGDRLWVAMNPEVPVNKTEVQEYTFPSLELVRSLIHDDCMCVGEIVISPEGEPLLAGCYKSGEEYMDSRVGFLPMLEKNAEFEGKPFEIEYDEVQPSEDTKMIQILNSYFCDAKDQSLFLLLAGYDYETGVNMTYVLDSNDGSIYEVGEGFPVGWQ